jgi:hypothetical protein
MNKHIKIVCAALSCALLVAGLLSPNLYSIIPSGRTSASQQSGKHGSPEELPAKRLAAREMTQSLVEINKQYQIAGKAERKRLLHDLREAVASRKQLLAELMESDPGEVLRVALPASIRENLPSAIRDEVEQQVDVEGELEVMYEDWEDGSRLHYSLDVAGERLSLHFAGNPMMDLLTGSRLRVKGVRVEHAVALESGSEGLQTLGGTGFETMAMAVAPNTFGEQKVLVLLVNFQDKQTQPWTPDQVRNVVFTSANNFYKESSYQQTWLTGNVFGWYTLPISSTSCDTSTIATYAKQAATAAGVNLSAYNRYVYAFPSLSCGWTGWGTYGGNPSQSWINGSMSLRTVAHELGHNFGLYHARAMDCHPDITGNSCSTIEYGDILDILGKSGVTGHSHAHQKERVGWLGYGSSPGLTTVQLSGTYWIDPYETVGTNPKALKILKYIDPTTGRKTWYYVEFRRPLGFDSFISSNNNVMNGVMVHTGTESYSFDLYLLDMTPETTSWSDAALVVGRSYNDPNTNITITPLSVSNTGAAVNVSFGSQPCARANPSVTVSPSATQWVAAGSSVTYQLSLTNNDSGACAVSNFGLQASVPSGWTAVFNSSSLNVNPGGNALTTLTVTSPSTAANGFYNLSVTAANSGDSSYSSTASMTCSVISSLGVTVSSNQSSYTRNQTATVTALVSSGGSPVSGASVTFTMTKADGSTVTGTATTAANGSAAYSYRFNKRQDPVGTYQVTASANLNGVSGTGSTSFAVR